MCAASLVRGKTRNTAKKHWSRRLPHIRSATTGCKRLGVVDALLPIRPIPRGATPRFEVMPTTCRARIVQGELTYAAAGSGLLE
jgi:hypothetical protein